MTIKSRTLLIAVATLVAACNSPSVAATDTNSAPKSGATMQELFGDPVIAKGKDIEIKRSDLDGAMVNIKSSAAARGQAIPAEQLKMIEQQVLQRLIQVQLLDKKATDAQKTEGKERAEKRMDLLLQRAGSETQLNTQLKAMGMERSELLAKLTEEATAEVVAENDLDVVITEEEAKKYYDEHPSQFEEPERVKASHILLMTINPATRQELSAEQKAVKKKELEDILKQARAGADFAQLAEKYSEDTGSKDRGGEYTFPRGQMVPEFEAAAFAMSPGQISDIVTTAYGYHIIKLQEKLPANKLTFEKVEDDLKNMLKQQAMVKKLPTYMENLRKSADVEILVESLKPQEDPFRALTDEMNSTAPAK
ncbi:MAG TPA: peptidylprolyl isomerase [Verrucomicrobiota bacterium]|nr:peptidylprolyl isomerase [Verrucomicrobiota bacterium]